MNPKSPILAAIQPGFERESGYPMPDRVLVAVSGGADSVALLKGLAESSIEVGVAHLDHGTRDGQSSHDADWVLQMAESMEVPFFLKHLDVPALAEASNRSFEEVARHERYDFLVETASANGYPAIATGHHQNDQAETVLMRIVRGTSPTGLAGIPGVGKWKGVPVIRPLLDVSREEIIEYMKERNVSFLEDSSNRDEKYDRNRIRHTLMPLLRKDFNPRVDSALVHLAKLSRDEDELLHAQALEALGRCVDGETRIGRAAFRQEHKALQRRLLVRLAHRVGGIGDFDMIDGAVRFVERGDTGSRYDFGNGVSLSNGRDETLIVVEKPERAETVSISVPGTTRFDGVEFVFSFLDSMPEDSLKKYCTATRQVVDGDALGNSVVIRHREQGDRFAPFGLNGTRKLKDYFGDLGIPLEERDRIPIVARGEEIVWIVGYAVSDAFAVRETTKRGVLIEVADGTE